LITLKVKFG